MNAQRRLLEDVTLAIMQREHYRSLQNKESLTAAEITGLDEDAIRRYQYDPMFHATVDSYAHSVWEVVKNLSTKLDSILGPLKAPSEGAKEVFAKTLEHNPESDMKAVPNQWLLDERGITAKVAYDLEQQIESLQSQLGQAEIDRSLDAKLLENVRGHWEARLNAMRDDRDAFKRGYDSLQSRLGDIQKALTEWIPLGPNTPDRMVEVIERVYRAAGIDPDTGAISHDEAEQETLDVPRFLRRQCQHGKLVNDERCDLCEEIRQCASCGLCGGRCKLMVQLEADIEAAAADVEQQSIKTVTHDDGSKTHVHLLADHVGQEKNDG